MPNSLKSKIKHLCHNRTITESECDRILKALEQEPRFVIKSDGTIEQIKNCNDCLLRKEWEKIGKMLSTILGKHTEQEPKTGHWIDNQYDKDFSQCSECGSNWEKLIIENYKMNYCPNCGAKMVEPKESEEEE